jgi:uncharacterized membrane protein YgdD (TMEM256/DUF423 family)
LGEKMKKWILPLVGVNGFVAVAFGAFGAHKLKPLLSPKLWSAYDTAVSYHFYHTLALMGCAWLIFQFGRRGFGLAAYFFQAGILLFSGSLYAMALGGPAWLGPVTPLGGLLLMSAWLIIAFTAIKNTREYETGITRKTGI